MKSKHYRLLMVGVLGLLITAAVAYFMWPVDHETMLRDHIAGLNRAVFDQDMDEFEKHRDALFALGYFEQEGFTVPTRPGFIEALMSRAGNLPVVTWRPQSNNATLVVVTATPEDMSGWHDFMAEWTQQP